MTRREDTPGLARFALVGAAAASVLVVGSWEMVAGFAVLAALALPVAAWLGLRPGLEPGERRLVGLFAVAVGVRAGVAVVAEYAAGSGFFASDDHRYELVGWALARYWTGEAPAAPQIFGPTGYYRWNALLFLLVGRAPVAPALANAVVGGVVAVLAWRIARELTDATGARVAAWLAALWPSLVLWSSLNLKDALAILALLLAVHGTQRLARRPSLPDAALLLGGLLLLAQLRGYLVGLTAVSMALSWGLTRLRASPALTAPVVVVVALVLALAGPAQHLQLEASFRDLEEARSELAVGRAAYGAGADVSTPSGALRFLPLGLAYFLFAPAPWQLLGTRQLLTLPEMLAWYALVPFVWMGLAGALRERFAAAIPVATLALALSVSYAMVEGNMGTAYRHRAQVLVLFLILAGAGIARRRATVAARREARAAAPRGLVPAAAEGAP